MPTYHYRCASCEQHLEVVQSMSDDPITECAACGGPMQKVLHPVGIVLKGSGFYRTDSRSSSKPAAKTDTKAEAKAESKDGTSDTKAESKDGKSEAKKPAASKGSDAKSA